MIAISNPEDQVIPVHGQGRQVLPGHTTTHPVRRNTFVCAQRLASLSLPLGTFVNQLFIALQ